MGEEGRAGAAPTLENRAVETQPMELVDQSRPVRVKRDPAVLTRQQVAQIAKEVDNFVHKMLRRRAPFDPGEVQQEAWVAALGAARTWDPARGAPLGHYVCRAIQCHVPREMAKGRALLKISKGAASRAAEISPGVFSRGDLELEERRQGGAFRALAPTPAEAYDTAEWQARRVDRRRAYLRAASRLPCRYREIARAILARAWLGLELGEFGTACERLGLGTRREARRARRYLEEAMLDEPVVWDSANDLQQGVR